jgi:hypothetical protein
MAVDGTGFTHIVQLLLTAGASITAPNEPQDDSIG